MRRFTTVLALAGTLSLLLSIACSPPPRGDTGAPEADTTADGASDATDGESPDSADGGEERTLREIYKEVFSLVAQVRCGAAFSCEKKLSANANNAFSRYQTEASCSSQFANLFTRRLDSVVPATKDDIDKGLTTFNRSKAQTCIDKLETRLNNNECRNIRIFSDNVFPRVCNQFLSGTQAQGDACDDDFHCQSGRCDNSANSGKCYGACIAATQYAGSGDPCTRSDDINCNPSEGLVCVGATSSSKGTCERVGVVSRGSSCESTLQCAGGLQCLNGTCQEITPLAQGESCDWSSQEKPCEIGLICDLSVSGIGSSEMVSGTCSQPGGAGAGCYQHRECKSDFYCDGGEYNVENSQNSKQGTCKSKKANGESCNSNRECKSGDCEGGTCEGNSPSTCNVPTGN